MSRSRLWNTPTSLPTLAVRDKDAGLTGDDGGDARRGGGDLREGGDRHVEATCAWTGGRCCGDACGWCSGALRFKVPITKSYKMFTRLTRGRLATGSGFGLDLISGFNEQRRINCIYWYCHCNVQVSCQQPQTMERMNVDMRRWPTE
jgi:hypothetical protein